MSETIELRAPDYSVPREWSLAGAYMNHVSSRADRVISEKLTALGVDPAKIDPAAYPTYSEAYQLAEARERQSSRM